MQMVAVIFRKSLENEIFAVLRSSGVHAFTDIAEVLGAGEAGVAFNSFTRPGVNSLVLAALDDADAQRLVQALRGYRDGAMAQRGGAAVPMRVFVLPCEQAV
jgi:hypothetical protein